MRYPEQLWQVPARFLSDAGFTQNDAIFAGERLVAAGLITVETAETYLVEHPEHTPQV